ncbi:MAG: YraN family protein [Clostridiales bacterium]|jgi:putative endonuclease|nr:YraN family protein [Clostridiales bacterium]
MIDNRTKGRSGEDMAVKYLKKHGYGVLERNYAGGGGEIDIVAYDTEYVIFVEVKSRFSLDFGYAAEAVDFQKRRKINQAAAIYIKQNRLYHRNVRFDVVEVYTGEKKIVHIKNAFDSYLRY